MNDVMVNKQIKRALRFATDALLVLPPQVFTSAQLAAEQNRECPTVHRWPGYCCVPINALRGLLADVFGTMEHIVNDMVTSIAREAAAGFAWAHKKTVLTLGEDAAMRCMAETS